MIAVFGVPAFLVTLAGMFLARGAAFVVSLESIGLNDPLYMDLGTRAWFLPLLFAAAVAVGAWTLKYRPFGRAVYAVGGGEASAHLMGLPVAKVKVGVYALSGFTAALAGVSHGFYTISGNAAAGTMLELDCIAAVVIGGTLLQGGVGNMIGTLFGVALLGAIQTILTFEGTLSSWWTKIVIGGLMLAFIVLQRAVEAGLRLTGRKPA
jgi:simple sugar transport system permease protein